ncbi:DNA-3-methyladenine glycosylase [Filimonas effusa]|uniref:Putative 3-methyladenine DNA glycosylase n=1 Tax=Filimonas effusa TaxID=2508721 RepID=A0A4Q1D1R8_9BACT|nr:DNA-3-methyladenine glycosylase [Filimonas effusa]RXK81734.1 DNA-3-methyladenine glycosylase [Filimonas effusa]
MSYEQQPCTLPSHWQILPAAFYEREDVVQLARELIGKILVTCFDGVVTAGYITETEAYEGVTDRACHAWNGRRSNRTEVMYSPGGTAYVYLCYGIHHLFNVVTNKKDIPHAILIRGITPLVGVEHMLARTGKTKVSQTFGSGPGNVSKALGIHTRHTGQSLINTPEIFIASDGTSYPEEAIVAGPRIGVDYAGEDAKLPYRFLLSL